MPRLFMKRQGVQIETFEGAGRYQHKVRNIGVTAKDLESDRYLPAHLVEPLKRAMEQIWDYMPEGARGLTLRLTYRVPRRR